MDCSTSNDLSESIGDFFRKLFSLRDGITEFGNPQKKIKEILENGSSIRNHTDGVLDDLSSQNVPSEAAEPTLDSLRRLINEGLSSDDASVKADAEDARDRMEQDGVWNDGETSDACDEPNVAQQETPAEQKNIRVVILDPLVIDLDGDGIELVSLENSSVQFDLDGNGFAESTGWVSADDGFLVRDVDGDGIIQDVSELFGDTNGFEDGFLNLASFDENQDGMIDASDSVYSELEIWRDLNQNGVSDEGELFSLQDIGIESINLSTSTTNELIEGNWVPKTSTVTYTDGTQTDIAAVFFARNPFVSTPVLDPDFEADPEASLMPHLPGTGAIASTDVALTQDPALKAQAENLLSLLEAGNIAVYHDAFDDFFMAWTGASEVDADGRGLYVDGQKLAALEAIYGQPYTLIRTDLFGNVVSVSNTPDDDSGPELNALYDSIRDWLSIRFIAQSAASTALLNTQDYSDWSAIVGDFLEHPLHRLDYLVDLEAENETQLQGSLATILLNFDTMINEGSLSDADAASIGHLLTYDFGPTTAEFIANAKTAGGDVGLTLQDEFFARIVFAETHEFVAGTVESDSLSSTVNGPQFIYGYGGDDTINGDDAGNFLIGGTGNDVINGGLRADTYVYSLGDGSDTITDYSSYAGENDKLTFTDVNASDVTFLPNADKDLVITLSNGETIVINDGDGFTIAQRDHQILVRVRQKRHITRIHIGEGQLVIFASIAAVVRDRIRTVTQAMHITFCIARPHNRARSFLIRNGFVPNALIIQKRSIRELNKFHPIGRSTEVINDGDGFTIAQRDHQILVRVRQKRHITRIHIGEGQLVIFASIAAVVRDRIRTVTQAMHITFCIARPHNRARSFLIRNGFVPNALIIQKRSIRELNKFHPIGRSTEVINDGDGFTIAQRDHQILVRVRQKRHITRIHIGEGQLVIFASIAAVVRDRIRTVTQAMHITFCIARPHNRARSFLIRNGFVPNALIIQKRSIRELNKFHPIGRSTEVINDGDGFTIAQRDHQILVRVRQKRHITRIHIGEGQLVIFASIAAVVRDRIRTVTQAMHITFCIARPHNRARSFLIRNGFVPNADKDLVITLSNGETITIIDHFSGSTNRVELVEFADGTLLDNQGIRDKAVADQKASGTVVGSSYAEGYVHSLGDGSYTITDYSSYAGENDKLTFTDVNASDVTFLPNADKDLVITLSNGETITIIDHFSGSTNRVELVEFADGTLLDNQGIRDKAVADQKASGTVVGSSYAEGYVHSLGDGSYTITDYSSYAGENDKLTFTDVNASDVTFLPNADKDLVITLSNGETITIIDHFTGNFWGLDSIEFADGTVLNTQDIQDKVDADRLAANIDPIAADDTGILSQNSTILLDVLSNDTDGDGDTLVLSSVEGVSNGTVTIENGQIRYTPDVGFSGQETLVYTVSDGYGGTDTATVTITVNPVSAPLGDQVGTTNADVFYHTTGNGSYTITDYDYYQGNDRLVFTDLNPSDVTLSRSGNDAVLSFANGETITLVRYLDENLRYSIETIEFADGTTWDHTAFRNQMVSDMKATGTVVGTDRDETYVHNSGDGSYTITDYDYYQGNDRLVFTDLNPSDVTLSRSGNDAVLSFANGETITLVRYLDENLRYSIETIEFADGTTWDHTAFRNQMVSDMKATGTVVGTDRDETYVHNSGDGSYTITDYDYYQGNDRLVFTDLNPSDVTLSRSGNDAVLSFANGETITLVRYLDGNLRYSIETIEFADGTTWDHTAFRNQMVSDMKATGTVVGTDRDETYVHNSGDGSYTITDYDYYQGNDRLVFTDLNPSDVTLSRSGNDAVLSFANGETITLVRYLDGNLRYSIETIEFADGTTWDHTAFRNQMVSDMKATGTVVGTDRDETYVHNSGDGSYTITDYDYYQGNDRLVFTDLNPSDVTLSRSGNDAVLSFANGETITLVRYLDENLRYSIETIEFADGTTWDHTAFRNQMVSDMKATGTVVGTDRDETYVHNSGDGSYTITDYDYYQGNDRLVFTDLNPSDVTLSRSGNDAVLSFANGETITLVRYLDENLRYSIETIEFADGTTWDHTAFRNQMVSDMKATGTVVGTDRDETYVHNSGDGSYTITDYDYYQGNDRLVFTDLNPSDVTLSRSGNDAVLSFANGETITLVRYLDENLRYSIETIEFADGTTWDHTAFRNQMVSDMKATGTVVGTDRDETYVHNSGDGSYTITDYDYYQGNDEFVFVDVNSTDVTVERLESDPNDVVLTLSNGDQITFLDQLVSNNRHGVETIEFADGVEWTRSDLLGAPVVDDSLVFV